MEELRRDLSMARSQIRDLVIGMQRLEGTFASIETHMVTLFEQRLLDEKRFTDLESRVKALEQKAG